MKVNVFDLIGEHAVTIEDGEKLYELIFPELLQGHLVELEFASVAIFSSPFFNFGIGRLLKDITPDDLNRLLKISNLTPVGGMVLRSVIENSKQYYLADERIRAEVDEILSEDFEEM